MTTKHKLQKETCLHTCSHRIEDRSVITSLSVVDNGIQVKCMEYRTYQSWEVVLSFCTVSALIQRYHGRLPVLWDLICRSMQFSSEDWEVHLDTQHITTFPVVSNSKGNKAYNVFENTKHVGDEVWTVDFYVAADPPNSLEISVRRSRHKETRDTYHVEGHMLKDFFDKYCLEYSREHSKSEAERHSGEDVVETNHMLNRLIDEMIYDEKSDEILVPIIEIIRIHDYLDNSLASNHERFDMKELHGEHDTDKAEIEAAILVQPESIHETLVIREKALAKMTARLKNQAEAKRVQFQLDRAKRLRFLRDEWLAAQMVTEVAPLQLPGDDSQTLNAIDLARMSVEAIRLPSRTASRDVDDDSKLGMVSLGGAASLQLPLLRSGAGSVLPEQEEDASVDSTPSMIMAPPGSAAIAHLSTTGEKRAPSLEGNIITTTNTTTGFEAGGSLLSAIHKGSFEPVGATAAVEGGGSIIMKGTHLEGLSVADSIGGDENASAATIGIAGGERRISKSQPPAFAYLSESAYMAKLEREMDMEHTTNQDDNEKILQDPRAVALRVSKYHDRKQKEEEERKLLDFSSDEDEKLDAIIDSRKLAMGFMSDLMSGTAGDLINRPAAVEINSRTVFEAWRDLSRKTKAAVTEAVQAHQHEFLLKNDLKAQHDKKVARLKAYDDKVDAIVNENKRLFLEMKAVADASVDQIQLSNLSRKDVEDLTTRKATPESTYYLAREALALKPETRSEMSKQTIIELLKTGSSLSKHLSECSADDLMTIAQACTLKEITVKLSLGSQHGAQMRAGMAAGGIHRVHGTQRMGGLGPAALDPFHNVTVHDKREVIANTGDIISTCYIVLGGRVDIGVPPNSFASTPRSAAAAAATAAERASGRGRSDSEAAQGNKLRIHSIEGAGCFLGGVIFDGKHNWDKDIHTAAINPDDHDTSSHSSVKGTTTHAASSEFGPMGNGSGKSSYSNSGNNNVDMVRSPGGSFAQARSAGSGKVLTETLILCCIPAQVLLHSVGRGGKEAHDYAVCFWKFTRLWGTLIRHNKDAFTQTLYQTAADNVGVDGEDAFRNAHMGSGMAALTKSGRGTGGISAFDSNKRRAGSIMGGIGKGVSSSTAGGGRSGTSRRGINGNLSHMNVIETARIRVYPAGCDVFTQQKSRHHLYLIIQGNTAYVRKIPNVADMPNEIDTGSRLVSGDFSFMDGENELFLRAFIEKQQHLAAIEDRQEATSDQNELLQLRAQKQKKSSRFGYHKNSLVALTRCEILVVPIIEISKSYEFLIQMLRLAHQKYPATSMSDEQLIMQYHQYKHWHEDRHKVLRELAVERADNLRIGSTFEENLTNNLNEALIHKRTLGTNPVYGPTNSERFSAKRDAELDAIRNRDKVNFIKLNREAAGKPNYYYDDDDYYSYEEGEGNNFEEEKGVRGSGGDGLKLDETQPRTRTSTASSTLLHNIIKEDGGGSGNGHRGNVEHNGVTSRSSLFGWGAGGDSRRASFVGSPPSSVQGSPRTRRRGSQHSPRHSQGSNSPHRNQRGHSPAGSPHRLGHGHSHSLYHHHHFGVHNPHHPLHHSQPEEQRQYELEAYNERMKELEKETLAQHKKETGADGVEQEVNGGNSKNKKKPHPFALSRVPKGLSWKEKARSQRGLLSSRETSFQTHLSDSSAPISAPSTAPNSRNGTPKGLLRKQISFKETMNEFLTKCAIRQSSFKIDTAEETGENDKGATSVIYTPPTAPPPAPRLATTGKTLSFGADKATSSASSTITTTTTATANKLIPYAPKSALPSRARVGGRGRESTRPSTATTGKGVRSRQRYEDDIEENKGYGSTDDVDNSAHRPSTANDIVQLLSSSSSSGGGVEGKPILSNATTAATGALPCAHPPHTASCAGPAGAVRRGRPSTAGSTYSTTKKGHSAVSTAKTTATTTSSSTSVSDAPRPLSSPAKASRPNREAHHSIGARGCGGNIGSGSPPGKQRELSLEEKLDRLLPKYGRGQGEGGESGSGSGSGSNQGSPERGAPSPSSNPGSAKQRGSIAAGTPSGSTRSSPRGGVSPSKRGDDSSSHMFGAVGTSSPAKGGILPSNSNSNSSSSPARVRPEYYVAQYHAALHEEKLPKQRFVEEFIKKTHL